ncbi:MAG: His/Gly/Thr/Pro-type tRNA ligase C-terminal domain-containing protein, partial [Patescibacteria group bacterium]
ILEMKRQEIEPPVLPSPQIFFAQIGAEARRIALRRFEEIRAAGLSVVESFGKASLKAQLETANRSGARFTIILGQKEVMEGTMIVRDMESGAQESIADDKVVEYLKKELKG